MVKKSYAKSIKSKTVRGRVVRAVAKSTKGGSGRINKRPAYKKAFK